MGKLYDSLPDDAPEYKEHLRRRPIRYYQSEYTGPPLMGSPLEAVVQALTSLRGVTTPDEMTLQNRVARTLEEAHVPFQREVCLGGRENRIDFVALDTVGIECKIKGGAIPLVRQLSRYCAQKERPLTGLVVVTTWALASAVPIRLHDIPVHAFVLFGGL